MDGRIVYQGEQGETAKTGVDVSAYQEYIDWDAVAADGIRFALIRVGYRGTSEGAISQDDYFEYNLQAAHDAGIECGVYFFSQAVSVEEAQEEADFVLAVLGGASLEYPVAFDYELNAEGVSSRTTEVSSGEATAIAQAFCQRIEDGGYQAMLYGNAYDLDRFDLDALAGYDLWFAEYTSYPSARRAFAVWQYSSNGSVAGIDAAVDLNLDMRG